MATPPIYPSPPAGYDRSFMGSVLEATKKGFRDLPDSNAVTFTQTGTGAVARTIGAKLSDGFVTPEDFGAVGTISTNAFVAPSVDSTAAVQAAINEAHASNRVCLLTRRYGVSSTIYLPKATTLMGTGGQQSGLHALGTEGSPMAGAVLSTWDGVSDTFDTGRVARNFSLSGYAEVGMVISQTIMSVFEDIIVTAPGGFSKYSFIIESAFSNYFRGLAANGGLLAGFKIGKCVLNSTWENCWTANTGLYNLHVDSTAVEYALGTQFGFQGNVFRNFAAQNAIINSVFLESAAHMTFTSLYCETGHQSLRIGNGQTEPNSSGGISFFQCNFQGNLTSNYGVLLDSCGNIHFHDCVFPNEPFIVDKIWQPCSVTNPYLSAVGVTFDTLLYRKSGSSTLLPLYASYSDATGKARNELQLPTSAANYTLIKSHLDNTGARVAAAFVVPVETPLTKHFDTATWAHQPAANVTLNATRSPDTTTTADKLVESAITSQFGVYIGGTGGVDTFRLCAKAAERRYAQIYDPFAGSLQLITVDLQTGTVVQNTLGLSITVTEAPYGFYSIVMPYPVGTSYIGVCALNASTASSAFGTNYAGTAGSGVYIW